MSILSEEIIGINHHIAFNVFQAKTTYQQFGKVDKQTNYVKSLNLQNVQ